MKGIKTFTRENDSNQLTSTEKLLFEISWLKTSEAAEYLRTSPAQIRNWVYQGKIKAHKLFDRSLRFKKSDLDFLLKEGDQEWV